MSIEHFFAIEDARRNYDAAQAQFNGHAALN
jgi:hypothetical protein